MEKSASGPYKQSAFRSGTRQEEAEYILCCDRASSTFQFSDGNSIQLRDSSIRLSRTIWKNGAIIMIALDYRIPTGNLQPTANDKRGQVSFAGTARRVLWTNET
jgi:hypothetical protein